MRHQARTVVVLAAATGLATGLAVRVFDWLTRERLFASLARQDHWIQVVAPTLGLVMAAGALRWLGDGATAATADEYVANFHQQDRLLDQRPVVGRVAASVVTLGLGGAMGYEGPSIYLGAAIGSLLQRRVGRLLSAADAKVLLVSGAAAGVAAIFKAPATGLVFALEVPYQEDFARGMLVPAGVAAAVSYLTFVGAQSTKPLFAVQGTAPFDLPDLGGAIVLGVLCGIGARVFVTALAGPSAPPPRRIRSCAR